MGVTCLKQDVLQSGLLDRFLFRLLHASRVRFGLAVEVKGRVVASDRCGVTKLIFTGVLVAD